MGVARGGWELTNVFGGLGRGMVVADRIRALIVKPVAAREVADRILG